MKSRLTVLCAITVGLMMPLWAHPVHAGTSGLTSLLINQLGVTSTQAESGSGAILGYAKQMVSATDFSKVTAAMPETESLIKAAPTAEGTGGLAGRLSDASSLLGGGAKTGSLAGMADLSSIFSSLGLDSGMIGQFVPIILEYAQSKGGETVSSILKVALQAL